MTETRTIPIHRLLHLREQAAKSGNTAALVLLDRLIRERVGR
ncbi:hypothetical protein [Nocardia cyriacigeorgica]|nr:hypothetical protein [Nocardia cyriacigeorgica]